ncbi:putative bifunctional diguanylate cyclase/phosphodiesterase [Ferrovum myxofaciens]|uniref:putative bifunctional diguanylate cyclase/phosphodiesterase n=1 Tax=Ferrovum myxofaciens TaxID=416213 RepID=UPI001AFBF1AB|nr:EAL domain-containing protein [Ferrovum myxofaciens]QKE39336.2 MAG: EAL domain-containing protein [Ferrovum myxofaciens]QWY74604.1 MAG: EAL domain-containing protein [Ferrovum myxofaciens]
MNGNDEDGVSNTDDSGSPGMIDEGKDRLFIVRGNDRRRERKESRHLSRLTLLRREDLATVREDSATVREDSATAREDSATVREDAVQVREHDVNLLEQEIRTAETTQQTSDDHMIVLQQANERLVIAAIEAHKLAEQILVSKTQLDHLAHHDGLTNLPNRLLLHDRLGQAIESAHRRGGKLALMFMDVDRFKNINDSLGHVIGDQLLQSVAKRLVECVRHSDTVCRQGGDEFIILLGEIEYAEDAALSAQKVLTALVLPHCIDQHDLYISVSIGISIYPDDGLDAASLIKGADMAMYHTKENGGNNYTFFEHHMNARVVQKPSIETDLQLALKRQEFVLYYQPKINLHSGAIVGVEALIHWRHPQRGLILPEQFVRIAEDCGLIVSIGEWVLREACKQAKSWQDAGLSFTPVAVNISAAQFELTGFLESLADILEDTGLEPRYLEFELTESVLMQNTDTTAFMLKALKVIGIQLAVDDFGTGFSSLSCLKHFPIDTLKIDQSFIHDITQATGYLDDAALVIAVIGLGKSLNFRVIAEGVETHEQLEFLLGQGCREGQGYYFSRPVTEKKMLDLLKTGRTKPF